MNTVLDIQRLVPAWQSLQSVAAVTHIDSEAKYAQTTALLNSLLDVVRDDAQHPLYSLVSVVLRVSVPTLPVHEPLDN